ncbi:hypothetical protein [Christiangramia sp. LLG6405-1]|uniref:hypothetical protein n=1 Tax=Christiangramia sp. LLG6405-1 TaxID=3160832 RepID=UPI003863861A
MRKILAVLGLLAIISCNSNKAVTGSKDIYSLENLSRMSSEDISRNYPQSNMEEGVDEFEEGTETKPYSILFPETEDEVLITWQTEEKKKVSSINYSGEGRWTTADGIKVGMSLEELNKLNGKPVSFYGFGWDYSGAVDWNGGKLAKSGVGVFLKTDKDIPNKFYGDKIVKASEEEIFALELQVGSVMLMNEVN